MKPTVIDFETKKIESRPKYPPRPVGMAIREPSTGRSEYLAFAHPSGNNCTFWEARRRYAEACARGPIIYHNAAFDIDVGEMAFGVKPATFHDTLYLGFLVDPYAQGLHLKVLADKHLGMPNTEQAELDAWILANIPEAKRRKARLGEFIGECPGDIVEAYGMGDTDRTWGLYEHFYPEVKRRGMLPAYERELALTTTTMEMERSGVRVDMNRLKDGLFAFETLAEQVIRRIHRKLRVGKDFNLNSPKQLSEALIRMDKLDAIVRTAKGNVSTTVKVMRKTCNDPELLNLLSVYSVLDKYITSFMRPWIEQGEMTDGRILPTFNQVRGRSEEGGGGARSGRYSSSNPNLQNVATNAEESANAATLLMMRDWLKAQCSYEFIGLRDYILPDEDSVMICVDYNQQELRIFAHFEQDVLMRAYIADPTLDVHTFCQQLVKKVMGVEFPRKYIKVTVFGILYGMGVDKLAAQLEVSRKIAKQVRDGIYAAIPGIRKLQRLLRSLADRDKPLTTWGGREYFCEAPVYNKKTKSWMTFEYKMLNYLIQPSAADCTKQAMLNVREAVPQARIAIQVHDELVCMAPSHKYGPRIAEAMGRVKMRVPMYAEPKYSTASWARAKKLEEFMKEAA